MKKNDLNIKSIRYNKTSTIVVVIFMFIFANLMPLFAVENKYNNQLLKLNVDKSTKGRINITVTTSKPYKIKLSPMKRSDNEYVILLPDTYHSITTKPDISKVADLQDIDIKLIPYIGYQNNNNGYTKITIKTKSNNTKLNINDEVSGQKPTINSELSKLIGQTALKPNTKNINDKKPLLPKNKIAVNNSPHNKVIQKSEQINNISAKKINDTEKSNNLNPASKLAETPQKPSVQIEKSASTQTAEQSVPQNQDITPLPTKNLQPVANINLVPTQKEPPKLNKKHIKSDNSTIKLILISLIALLALFIVVIRYFKSLLMKQMQQAEQKISAKKEEVPLTQKPQKVVKSDPPRRVPENPDSRPVSTQVPINRNRPKAAGNSIIRVIKGFQIENDKSFYLIQTKSKKMLIGTINSEVFLLKAFNNINNPKFIVKKEKTLRTKNVYYVQINNWRSLVSVSQDDMKLELVLDKTLVTH